MKVYELLMGANEEIQERRPALKTFEHESAPKEKLILKIFALEVAIYSGKYTHITKLAFPRNLIRVMYGIRFSCNY